MDQNLQLGRNDCKWIEPLLGSWQVKEELNSRSRWNSRSSLLYDYSKSKPREYPRTWEHFIHTFSHQLPALNKRLAPRSSIYSMAIINWIRISPVWTNQSAFQEQWWGEEDDCVSSDDGDGEEEETKTVVMRMVMVFNVALSATWIWFTCICYNPKR